MKTDIKKESLDRGHPCQIRASKLSEANNGCLGLCSPRPLFVLKGFGNLVLGFWLENRHRERELGLGFVERRREREPGPWTTIPD